MQTTLIIEPDAVLIVKSSLLLKHRALEFSQHRYRQRLADFEKKHKMTSEQFIKKLKTGKLGDEQEWFDWEFVLDAYQETIRQLNLLNTIRL